MINVNDLVYVAKAMPCCGDARDLGVTFKVERLWSIEGRCEYCNHHWPHPITLALSNTAHGMIGYPVEMLKKFDPKSAPNDVIEREPLPVSEWSKVH